MSAFADRKKRYMLNRVDAQAETDMQKWESGTHIGEISRNDPEYRRKLSALTLEHGHVHTVEFDGRVRVFLTEEKTPEPVR